MQPMRQTERNLKKHIRMLSETIGSRDWLSTESLEKTARYIKDHLTKYGYSAQIQSYIVDRTEYVNLSARLDGRYTDKPEILVGAHYDTVTGTPGADDNASGVAALLEIARILRNKDVGRPVRFVFFTLEEPPFFHTDRMGSFVYASELKRQGVRIGIMICLEMLGYYNEEPNTQRYPIEAMKLFYPDTANFIGIVGSFRFVSPVLKIRNLMRKHTGIGVESIAGFSIIPGIDFSDHWSFWEHDYPAVMITDTAFYRNDHYHAPTDTWDTLDFGRMTEVVRGLARTIWELSGEK